MEHDRGVSHKRVCCYLILKQLYFRRMDDLFLFPFWSILSRYGVDLWADSHKFLTQMEHERGASHKRVSCYLVLKPKDDL